MQGVIRVSGMSLLLAAVVALVACSSSGKKVVTDKPIMVSAAPGAQKDARGSYRFLMQQDGATMSVDQFDAWMKANGLRVVQGKPAAPAAARKVRRP